MPVVIRYAGDSCTLGEKRERWKPPTYIFFCSSGLLDYLLTLIELDPVTQATQVQGLLPGWLEVLALLTLTFLSLRPLRFRLLNF